MPLPIPIWNQATTAILDALNADGSPAAAYRARFAAVASSESAFNAIPHKIDCRYDCANDSAKIDFHVVIRIYVAAIDEVDLAFDPMIWWAWTQIRQDPTLGQLVEDAYVDNIEIGYLDKSANDQVCADMTIRVEVEVDRNNPAVNKTYGAQL